MHRQRPAASTNARCCTHSHSASQHTQARSRCRVSAVTQPCSNNERTAARTAMQHLSTLMRAGQAGRDAVSRLQHTHAASPMQPHSRCYKLCCTRAAADLSDAAPHPRSITHAAPHPSHKHTSTHRPLQPRDATSLLLKNTRTGCTCRSRCRDSVVTHTGRRTAAANAPEQWPQAPAREMHRRARSAASPLEPQTIVQQRESISNTNKHATSGPLIQLVLPSH